MKRLSITLALLGLAGALALAAHFGLDSVARAIGRIGPAEFLRGAPRDVGGLLPHRAVGGRLLHLLRCLECVCPPPGLVGAERSSIVVVGADSHPDAAKAAAAARARSRADADLGSGAVLRTRVWYRPTGAIFPKQT